MSYIYYFKPFEADYLNDTVSVYSEIISSMPDVVTVDLSNYHSIHIDKGMLCVYWPMALFGKNLTDYTHVCNRIRKYYNTTIVSKLSFTSANEYYNKVNAALTHSKQSICALYEYDLHDFVRSSFKSTCIEEYNSIIMFHGAEMYDTDMHKDATSQDIDHEAVEEGIRFLHEYQKNVISLPHVISRSDMVPAFHMLNNRQNHIFSAPGANYFKRRLFKSFCKSLHKYDYYAVLIRWIVMKIAFRLPMNNTMLRFLRRSFAKQIQNSRFTFTCGSTAGYPIRKIIEIPSNGSCLLSYKYRFMEDLGFVSSVHYLGFVKDSDLEEFVMGGYRKLDQQSYQKMIVNAAQVVLRCHSSYARYTQLCETFDRIRSGDFVGSYWSEGKYVIRS